MTHQTERSTVDNVLKLITKQGLRHQRAKSLPIELALDAFDGKGSVCLFLLDHPLPAGQRLGLPLELPLGDYIATITQANARVQRKMVQVTTQAPSSRRPERWRRTSCRWQHQTPTRPPRSFAELPEAAALPRFPNELWHEPRPGR